MNTRFLRVFAGICLLFLASCVKEPQPIAVTGITLNSSSLELIEGESAVIVATVSPKDADNQVVIWSSSNGSVASVNNGKVTALKAGSAEIMAKSDDGGFMAKCVVTVAAKIIEVTSISLSKTELILTEGDSETIIATVKPDDATDKTVTWSSSDSSVAAVDDGRVTAISVGSAVITAIAGDKSATCEVTISKRIIPVESVELDKDELSLIEGDCYTLTATVKPENATDKSVTWTSSNSSVASVEDGKVVAIKEGMTIIVAKAGDKTAFCEVTVEKKIIPVESVELNRNELSLTEGDSETLVATVKPDNATDRKVIWSSSDDSIATVENGIVTAVKEGTAIITAKAGEKSATCTVTVKAKIIEVISVTLNKDTSTLTEGDTEILIATVNPDNATDKTVTWSSSNTMVATVDSNGKVTAVKEGTATITAKAGEKTAACIVKVEKKIIHVESITLNKTEMSLIKGGSETLIAIINPIDATDQSVSWKSSDKTIATVDQTGKVSAIDIGTAVITVTTNDGSKTATCKVTVKSSGNTEPIDDGGTVPGF